MSPTQNLPIAGKIYDNNRVPLVGATVFLVDTTTGEQLSSTYYATTNANGEYILNMQNLSDYSDGDGYEVISQKTGYEDTKLTGTVSISGGPVSDADLFMEVTNHTINGTSREQTRHLVLKGALSKFKQSFMVWANNLASSATAFVITSGGGGWGKGYTKSGNPVINLNSDEVAYIEQITFMLRTDAKAANVEIVKCSSADGAGTATSISGQIYRSRGTSTEDMPVVIKFANPIRIEYNSESAKSIGIKTSGTDTSTYIDVSMSGYVLEE